MNKKSQLSQKNRFVPKNNPTNQPQPASQPQPAKNNSGIPPYKIVNDTQPGIGKSFIEGFKNYKLSPEEWYDYTRLTRQQWLEKYPNSTSEDYLNWRKNVGIRMQQQNQANWFERALIPPALRKFMPPVLRAII